MLTIGITGGTGCGKTAFLRCIEARGGVGIDCDALYYDLLRTDGALRAALTESFGAVFLPDGSLDRKRLGTAVFSDPAQMETLNRKPKRCKSSKKAWEREHEHGRRESCKLTVDCVLNSVSFSGFGRKTEYLTRKKQRIFERRKETETRLAP